MSAVKNWMGLKLKSIQLFMFFFWKFSWKSHYIPVVIHSCQTDLNQICKGKFTKNTKNPKYQKNQNQNTQETKIHS